QARVLPPGDDATPPRRGEPVADVGGVTFTYTPAATSSATLASDFADGCGTAFANMSRTLTPQQLASAERPFGIGGRGPAAGGRRGAGAAGRGAGAGRAGGGGGRGGAGARGGGGARPRPPRP